MMRRALFTSLLISFMSAAVCSASEPVAITEVLTDPDIYHLKLVTLQGTVRQVKALEPYFQISGSACYGAYTFTLEDGTGAIAVAVLGICGRPIIRNPEVVDGETVTVQAQIYAPGQLGYFRERTASRSSERTASRFRQWQPRLLVQQNSEIGRASCRE